MSRIVRVLFATFTLALGNAWAAVAPLTVVTSFIVPVVQVTQPSGLSFNLANPNASTLTGLATTTTLPAGLHVNNASAPLCGGTVTVTSPSTISLAGGSLAGNANCNFTVSIFTDAAGDYPITTDASSTEGGASPTSTATLDVEGPPTLSKSFSPSTIAAGATSSLDFSITNPTANPLNLTGVAFSDTLPSGLTVASGVANACNGGTLVTTAPNTISLSGALVQTNALCSFSVTVTGTAAGSYSNTTGAVTSGNGGTGNTATASLTVVDPPTVQSAFGAASIPLNATTSLTFTVTNPNAATSLTGVLFGDTVPFGLVIATPNGLTGSCGGGTIQATAGTFDVILGGATLAAGASCTISVNVQAFTAGSKTNIVHLIGSTEGGSGNPTSTMLAVIAPPTLSTAFGAATMALAGTTSLTFTAQNPNVPSLTGIGFTDSLPAGLVVATPNNLTGSCGGGTITATAGSGSISLSGASLAGAASCTFAVDVLSTAAGPQNNTTGAIASVEGGTGSTASASVTVVSNSFTGPTPSNGNATASFTGGGATCTFTSAAFVPLSSVAGTPPAGYSFPDGLFNFTTGGCTAGSTLAFTITYATALPAETVYWKYGPTIATPTPHWYPLPAAISGNTVTFSITDGGTGDSDLAADGAVTDPGGPGFAAGRAIPTLSEWMLAVLAALLVAGGWVMRRRST